jgi:hypothetical protein
MAAAGRAAAATCRPPLCPQFWRETLCDGREGGAEDRRTAGKRLNNTKKKRLLVVVAHPLHLLAATMRRLGKGTRKRKEDLMFLLLVSRV